MAFPHGPSWFQLPLPHAVQFHDRSEDLRSESDIILQKMSFTRIHPNPPRSFHGVWAVMNGKWDPCCDPQETCCGLSKPILFLGSV